MLRRLTRLLRYIHTLRHLRPSQWFWQVHYRFWPKSLPSNVPAPLQRQMAKALAPFPQRAAIFSSKHIQLLNRTVPIALLEDGWRVPGQSDLWHYHLHYFEDVVAEKAIDRRPLLKRLMADWVANNPPLTPVAWDAYPISRRSCFWMLAECANEGLLTDITRQSLAQQLRYLTVNLEKHLLANHLFANLKALWIASCFFEGDEAEKWRALSEKLLARELVEQFLPSGAHYEIAPLYHALLLEDLLDMVNIAESYAIAPPHGLREIIPRALAYLKHTTHPDGSLAHFHDTAQHIAPGTNALIAYAKRLGLEPEDMKLPHPIIRMEQEAWCVLFDPVSHGPAYQPGHTHAGFLALEVSHNSERLLVNQGTSSYARDARRSYERSTKAHNTLEIDGQNSCDVWASFRVGKRAHLYGMPNHTHDNNKQIISASHDGYRPIIHTRHIVLEDYALHIMDTIEGEGEHDIAVYLHGAPGVRLNKHSLHSPSGTTFRIEGWCSALPFSTKYGYSFNHRIETKSLAFKGRVCLPWEGTITLYRET